MSKNGVSLQDVLVVTTRIEDKIDKLHDELEPRVGSLERWRAEITGKMAVLAAVVSVAFTAVWEYARKKLNVWL